jgi:tol-pal system protein YbgF
MAASHNFDSALMLKLSFPRSEYRMIHTPVRALMAAAIVLSSPLFAQAQERDQGMSDGVRGRWESLERDTSDFFGQVFGGSERFRRNEAPAQAAPARATPARPAPVQSPEVQSSEVQMAQASPSDLVLRLDRLENQIRQLTGLVEQLQFRNQQLEQQLRHMQDPGAAGGQAPAPPQSRSQAMPPAPPPASPRRSDAYDPNDNPNAPGAPRPFPRRAEFYEPGDSPNAPRPQLRRPDVFDPNEHPNAPGAPRILGSIPSGPTVVTGDPDEPPGGSPIGVPGGRQAGAPLNLSTLSSRASNEPGLAGPAAAPPVGSLPPPPPRTPSATGSYQQQAMAPPAAATPKEEYDLAYGYLVRRDYAVAEENFRNFLRKNPNDRLVPEANYWLGESLFQRQRYREAAESYLNVSTKFEKSSKAPEALVRLGQSLAALKEKEAACATFLEVGRKYPRATPSVKQSVEREQKRAGC